jgi:hypothetical protein
MSSHGRLPTRREFLAVAALGTLSACGAARVEPVSKPASTSPSALAVTPTPTAHPALPTPAAWRPSSGDIEPNVKLTAARHIERIGTDSTHRVQVIEAQYGGLLADAASVLVVCRSWTLVGSTIHRAGHTFDVRLVRGSRGWSVIAVHPSVPGAPTPTPTTAARHVLASHRIVLPPAARADVASGQVHDSVLEAMLHMSQRWVVGVSVVRSGHPIYVFGTNRLSDHPRGRAFDTWQIDGHAVVAPGTSRSLITSYMHALANLGSYNVGGPVLLGSAPQFFSDQTHHDHVHAGFSR